MGGMGGDAALWVAVHVAGIQGAALATIAAAIGGGLWAAIPGAPLPRANCQGRAPRRSVPLVGAGVRLAARLSRLGTESAFEVLARARALEAEGRKVIHLEIGEPDFDTPSHIVEAAAEALREGFTHYVAAPGLPEDRRARLD